MIRAARLSVELVGLALLIGGAVFAILYLRHAEYLADPSRPEAMTNFLSVAVILSVAQTGAVWVLWLGWRLRAYDARGDAPSRALALVTTALPEERREWGAAMAAELAQIADGRERWRFVTGCARALLFPPRAAGEWYPRAGWLVAATGSVGVVACVAVTGWMLATYPSTAEALDAGRVIFLGAVLAISAWLAIAPPAPLADGALPRYAGVVAGLALGGALLVLSRTLGNAEGPGFTAPGMCLLVFLVLPGVVAAVQRNLWVGVRAAVWTGVFAGLALFAVYVSEGARYAERYGMAYLDNAGGLTIGSTLTEAIGWIFVFVAVLGVPLGIVSAGIGALAGRAVARMTPGDGRRAFGAFPT